MELIQIVIIVVCVILCLLIRMPEVMCIILAVGLLLSVGLSLFSNRRWNHRIDKLTNYLLQVQDRLDLPELQEISEGRIGILQSEIYKMTANLKECYNVERKQKRYMADMLSDISHQIKTPLSAIMIMTELLGQAELTDEQRMEYVSKIDEQASKIKWLIRNLLTLSQLEAGVLELKKAPVDFYSFMMTVQKNFEIMAEVKEVQLQIFCPTSIVVNCDEHWTMEAVSNIVKNCIEHTNANGKVSVKVSQDNIATHLYIEDDGEGIEPEHLPHIFERFYKSSKNADSVGIGLSMARQIILRQEGVISVESEIGKGTKFYIKFYS